MIYIIIMHTINYFYSHRLALITERTVSSYILIFGLSMKKM